MPVASDDDVVVHRNAQRAGDLDDLPGHLDVCPRRGRIAGRVIVHDACRLANALIMLNVFIEDGSVRDAHWGRYVVTVRDPHVGVAALPTRTVGARWVNVCVPFCHRELAPTPRPQMGL
jgi:hypothetical protein